MGSTRSKVYPRYKTRYRVINWPAYNRALRRRCEITIWFSPSLVRTWVPLSEGRRGGQKKYSDAVIELAQKWFHENGPHAKEDIYLHAYDDLGEARERLRTYFAFYNHERPHQSLGDQPPAKFYELLLPSVA